MKKHTYCFIFGIITTLLFSCISAPISEPEEGKYRDYTYEEIIKKHGRPKYDNIYMIDNNSSGYEIDPDYSLYFTKEELENSIEIRKLMWENIFNNRIIIVWMKNIDRQWIVFDSLEYNSKYIEF